MATDNWCGFLMAAAKRFTAEQIVAKLREAEKLQGQGATIPGLCKKLGVSVNRYRSCAGFIRAASPVRAGSRDRRRGAGSPRQPMNK
jgi:hypothetical protein